MTQPKRSRAGATQRAKPDPAPAAQAPPIDDDEPGAVRDNRGGGWFWAHNQIIDDYAPRTFQVTNSKGKTTTQVLGAVGVAVYCALARHANKDGECWPGMGKMAERLALSFNTVKTKLVGLEYLGLIAVTRNRRKAGSDEPDSNYYRLLPIPADGLSTIDRGLSTIDRHHRQPLIDQVYQPLTMNKTKGNKTQETTPPTPETGQAKAQHGGGGDAGKPEPEHAEQVMRELVKQGVARTPHTKRIAAKIAQHMPNLDVAAAVIANTLQNVKAGKPKNPPQGAMLTRLDAMTADDWKQTPATTVVIAREREE